MKMNMKEWVAETIRAEKKKAAPILSFPGIQITGHTVDEMVRDGHLQALCMEAIAKRFPTGAAFSLMDLSVEAEAFGSPVSYSEDEVPTVTAALVHDEEEAEALKVPEVGAGAYRRMCQRNQRGDRTDHRSSGSGRNYRTILTGRASFGHDRDHDPLL